MELQTILRCVAIVAFTVLATAFAYWATKKRKY